jgi:hypothetical protein
MPGNRCRIHREEQSGAGSSFTDKREDAVVCVIYIYPLKSSIIIVVLRKGRLALVKEIEMLDQPSKPSVQGKFQQVPIDTLVMIPFFRIP